MYFVYIIKSEKDGSFYIGYTSDLDRRMIFHNSGESVYTSKKVPWKLVYTESFDNKSDAIKRERFLKRQRNRVFYEKLINSSTEP